MIDHREAEEHLRVIRSLMERASIYRAIAAPSALVGGVASLVVALGMNRWVTQNATELSPTHGMIAFILAWSAVLALTGATNMLCLWRDAQRRGDRFISSGMRTALSSLAPSLATAALFTWLIVSASYFLDWVVFTWVVLYGVALLSTRHFAPDSMRYLGWAFLAIGFLIPCWPGFVDATTGPWHPALHHIYRANVLMALTFGLLHIVYAACTWPWKSPVAQTAVES